MSAATRTQMSSGATSNLRWSVLLIEVPIGILFFLFNFDGFLRFEARHNVTSQSWSNWLVNVSYLPRSIYAAFRQSEADLFYLLFRLALYGLGVYLVLIFLLALRRGGARTLLAGVSGLIAGLLSVPILAWAVFLILALAGILLTVVRFLIDLLVKLWVWLGPILKILLYVGLALAAIWLVIVLVQALWRRYKWRWIPVGLAAAVVAFLWGRPILAFLLTKVLWPIFQVLMAIATFLRQILGAILGFLVKIFGAILGFLVKILFFLLIVVTGIGILALLGHLLIDQYKAAWNNGSGARGVLAGSFSVGLAIGLVLLNCYGSAGQAAIVDGAWSSVVTFADQISPMHVFGFLIPPAYREAVQRVFSSLGYPLFDSLVLVTVLVLSYVGVIRGLFGVPEDRFRVTFIGREAAILAFGVVLGVLLLLAAAAVPSED